MASSEKAPSMLVPRVIFPLFIALGATAVAFFGLRDCDCDVPHTAHAATHGEAKTEAKTEEAKESPFGAAVMAKLGKFFSRKLSTGVELNIPENGIENKLVTFIEDKDKPLDKTTWFDFDRLLFDTGKSTLQAVSEEQLSNIAEIMKAYPQVELKLGGYTDNKGNPATNKALSQKRAEMVMDMLVKKGVEAKRLSAEGFGQEFPVANNDTEEGRQQNRRVSARITKK
ncbi:MAG: OmpA family protein [Candidatus Kapaibacterium sp.]|nr:MAG: OmpA family protein [Candidatus Kapabacteria bacterium]